MTTQKSRKPIFPEKYRECGLTVGLCACVQENKGTPEKDCEYCYGTGVSVYTNIDLPTPTNCPHWVNDAIYVKGFRCSLYRDVNRETHDTAIIAKAKAEERESVLEIIKRYCLVRSSTCGLVKQLCYDAVISKIESIREGEQ